MKSILYRLRNQLFSYGERSLFVYECACIYGFWSLLNEDGKHVLETQLRLYDRVQRSPNGKHLGFFDDESDGLCTTWSPSVLFPFKNGPVAMASIDLIIPGRKRVINAEIFFHAGRFAGIEFAGDMGSLLKGQEEISLKEISCESLVKYECYLKSEVLLINPMDKDSNEIGMEPN